MSAYIHTRLVYSCHQVKAPCTYTHSMASSAEVSLTKKPKDDRTKLRPEEIYWRDLQPWLAEKGYMLRPRYRPGWVASWAGKDPKYWEYEDSKVLKVVVCTSYQGSFEIKQKSFTQAGHVIDATRVPNGELVMLKRVSHNEHPYEKEISLFFSSEEIASHPRCHCVSIYDVLDIPEDEEHFILVLPLLREYDDPRIKSIGEAVEFFRQIFEVCICYAHRYFVTDHSTIGSSVYA